MHPVLNTLRLLLNNNGERHAPGPGFRGFGVSILHNIVPGDFGSADFRELGVLLQSRDVAVDE